MRILITGGTGLVGTPLVQALIARKYQVVVLSRSPQKVYSRFCSAAENLNSLNDITHLNDIDAVINLAGEPIADKRRRCFSPALPWAGTVIRDNPS